MRFFLNLIELTNFLIQKVLIANNFMSVIISGNVLFKKYEEIISAVTPIYNKKEKDITNGANLYFSPKSMKPKGSVPSFATNSLYQEVYVSGLESNNFRFFRRK